MEMREVDKVDLRTYKGPVAFICGNAEIIVDPINDRNERYVSYRSPAVKSGELIKVIPGRRQINRVGDPSPIGWGYLKAIYVPANQ